jgi:hypothetical protein
MLSKGNILSEAETAGYMQLWDEEGWKTREEEIAGWQLSWTFTLLHVLDKTNQVGYTNTYAKAKPSKAF